MKRRDLLKTAATLPALAGMTFSEFDIVASITREDFFEFVKEFWPTIETRELTINWHIPLLCIELQKLAERVFRGQEKAYDLLVNIPPGTTKSMICSVMFPAWVWTRMPEAQFITASYKHDLAMDLSRKSRDVILSEKYRACFPEIILRSDQKVKTHYMNTKGGFRVASGSGGTIGFHGHFIIVDDPIDPKEVSEAGLLSATIWQDETLSQRKVDKRVTPTILIMQRLHQGDPSAHMLEVTPNVKHICLPAEISDDVKPEYLKKYYQRGLLDPVRQSQKVLDEAKAKGEYFYSGQFMQNPKPRGGGMFKTEQFEISEVCTAKKWKKRIRYWDKGGTKDGGAYTVGVLMGKNCDGRYWVLDVVRGQWDAGTREQKIKQTAEIDGKQVIVGVEQEGGSGGKESAEGTIKRLAGYRVKADRPTGDKTTRADEYATQVNVGNVSLLKGDWNREYINELSFFPLSTYKDQVDASSGAFKLLTTPEPFVGVIGIYG